MNFMLHTCTGLLQWINLNRWSPVLQRVPIRHQLLLVKLCPRQHKSLLTARKRTR
jgi:hypothetical protein